MTNPWELNEEKRGMSLILTDIFTFVNIYELF